MPKIPKYLESSYALLERTFGKRIPAKYYESVVALMYDGLCDGHLVDVVGDFADGDRGRVDVVYIDTINNLEKLKETSEHKEALQLLEAQGYSEWLAEPDIFDE